MYPRFINYIHYIEKNRNVKFEAQFWMQGESDAKYKISAQNYQKNFKKLTLATRTDLKSPERPIIYGQINPPIEEFPYVKEVCLAQAQAENEIYSVKMFHTDMLEKNPDNIHYNISGQLELGKRLANGYMEMIQKNETK